MRPMNPPQSSIRSSPGSPFTQTSHISHPTSSRTERSGPPYRLAPKPPTHPKHSPRLLPPPPPHQRPPVAAKQIKTAHNQLKVKLHQSYYLLTLIVTSRRRPVLEGETATLNMPSRLKTCPRSCPSRWTLRDTSAN